VFTNIVLPLCAATTIRRNEAMKVSVIVCAITVCILVCAPYHAAHAIYYTIQLKNGNEIKSDKYWKDGDMIRFYTKEGVVGVSEKVVGQIVTSSGNVDLQTNEEVLEAISEHEGVQKSEAPSKEQRAKNEDLINDIKDRMTVVESNLESLAKNKSVYAGQLEQYQQQKQKSEERIQALKSDRFVTEKENKESIEFEQSKIKDFEDKIRDMQEKIERADRMIEAQTRMKERLEGELSQAQK